MGDTPRKSEQKEDKSEIDRLCDEIRMAIKIAPSKKEFLERQKIEKAIHRKVASGEKLSADERAYSTANLHPGEVEIPNFETLSEIFYRYGWDRDSVEKTIEHERAHFETAEVEGLEAQILIKLFKLEDGTVRVMPSIQTSHREDKEGLANSLRRTTEAPHDLSPSDIEKIN